MNARPDLRALEQLIDLLVRHLLPELGEHVPQLAGADEAVPLLVEHLEPANEFLWRQGSIDQLQLRT